MTVKACACLPASPHFFFNFLYHLHPERMEGERLQAILLSEMVCRGNPVELYRLWGEGNAGFPQKLYTPCPQDPLPVTPSC